MTTDTASSAATGTPLRCPSCRQPMTAHRFLRRLSGELEIDLCFSCHGIWFDHSESPQIGPGGIIDLIRQIHEHRHDSRQPLRKPLHCPRCDERLTHAMDRVKGGAFNYHRCLQAHGRFTTFAQFMVEKGFVRHLDGAEIDAIKARIKAIHCTGCGAPIDIRRDSACGHCGMPIAVLDPDAVDKALAGYQHAETARTSQDPLALGEALISLERQKNEIQRAQRSALSSDFGDLLNVSAQLVWNLMRR